MATGQITAATVLQAGLVVFRALPPEVQARLLREVRRLAGDAAAAIAHAVLTLEGPDSGVFSTDDATERAAVATAHLQVAAASLLQRSEPLSPTSTDSARGIA